MAAKASKSPDRQGEEDREALSWLALLQEHLPARKNFLTL